MPFNEVQYSSVGRPFDDNAYRQLSGPRPLLGSAGWTSSVINLSNTILGAGVLAMPHAMSVSGMFLGTLAIVFSAVASSTGLYLQSLCARKVERGQASFFTIAQKTYPDLSIVF